MIGKLLPRTRIALATSACCRCPCHDRGQGDLLEAAQHAGTPRTRPAPINGIGGETVETRDALSAVSACAGCLRHHAPALSGDPLTLDRAWWRWWSHHSPRPLETPAPAGPVVFGGGDGPEG